ncbi:MAG TPA: TatD family hydrolase [Candidatus Defluviicoccus seviourii]|nr:TatD family hydrolase [Candidatus Defluviicoccus seviourii]
MLVDSHCHLDFPDFAGDFDAVMARAGEAGVTSLLTICTHLSRAEQVIAVSERAPQIVCTVGVHPHEAAGEAPRNVDALIGFASHPKVVAFGESGLDYFYEHSPRAAQQQAFRQHIEAARTTGLPLVIHTRDADADTAAILEDEMAKGPFSGVLHCFSSTPALAHKAVALGLYISFSGILTFAKSGPLRDLAATLPLDRLLVETDAPFLAPVPKRGKRNEPAFVAHTAASLAKARGIDLKTLAAATTANFFRLFAKAKTACV